MADVSRSTGEASRGQVILVMGLAIAVVLVALVLLLNAMIYASNLATRGIDSGGSEAIVYEGTVTDGVQGVLARENAAGYDTQAAVVENVTDGVERLALLIGKKHLERSAVASVSNLDVDAGWRVTQTDASRKLTSSGGSVNWTVASTVYGTRGFAMTVNRSDLQSTTDPEEALQIAAVDGGTAWRAAVYHNASTGDVAVAVREPGEAWTADACSLDAPRAVVNLTAGTINDTSCSDLAFAEGVTAPYDVEVTYGNRSVGTYNLTVNTTSDVTAAVNDPDSATSPYATPLVYSVAFDLRYETASVTYAKHAHITAEASP